MTAPTTRTAARFRHVNVNTQAANNTVSSNTLQLNISMSVLRYIVTMLSCTCYVVAI